MSEKPKLSAGATAAADVAALLRARNPLLWIVSREEGRVERSLVDAAEVAQYRPVFWDCATGASDASYKPVDNRLTDPGNMLQRIRESNGRELWILRDLPVWFRDPTILRGLRTLARELPNAPRDNARAVVVLTPSSEIPPELQGHAIVLEWPLPDRPEVAAILDSAIASLPDSLRDKAAPNGTREAVIDAALGLSAEEIQACYAKSLVSVKCIEPAAVSAEKKRVIAREKVLEWFDPLPGGLEAVGGLDVLKSWLLGRRAAFSKAAKDYGLPAPKGALLVGVSGCGKSLTAKAIATAWSMPLLRLDMGALKSKWVGESEGNIRKALKVAETVAPCVLWLDEIEKALAGASQGAADGGVSGDALGAVLNWMQERAGSVFVVATANDVSQLPPELLRKGRFDELFFVDLPNQQERHEILNAALRQYGRKVEPWADPSELWAATEGFTGAEIAALVPDAMYAAFADGARDVQILDLLTAARRTVPLSKTASEKINALREWAKTRARYATTQPKRAAQSGRMLDV